VLLEKRELPTYENRNILTANENREFGSKKTSPNLDFTFFIFFNLFFSFRIFTFLLSSLRARHASVMVILDSERTVAVSLHGCMGGEIKKVRGSGFGTRE
jgi:hypothetical protein